MISFIAIALGSILSKVSSKNQANAEGETTVNYRKKTISLLKRLGIRYNPSLPLFIDKEECVLKTKRQINELMEQLQIHIERLGNIEIKLKDLEKNKLFLEFIIK